MQKMLAMKVEEKARMLRKNFGDAKLFNYFGEIWYGQVGRQAGRQIGLESAKGAVQCQCTMTFKHTHRTTQDNRGPYHMPLELVP